MPIGLYYVAAYLRSHGVPTIILDAEARGLGVAAILQAVMGSEIAFVGLNCTCVNRSIVYELCHTIKFARPDLRLILGGPQPSLAPESTLLECSAVDYVVFGEGEETAYELVSGRLPPEQIAGLGYRTTDGVQINGARPRIIQLDALPFPYPDSQTLHAYVDYQDSAALEIYRKAFLIASRGCSFSCTYCASPEIWGRHLTHRSAQNVLDEIEGYIIRHGITQFHFYDDNLTLWRGLDEFCRLAATRFRDQPIRWGCSGRIETMTPERIKLMQFGGCKAIAFGIESGSELTLRRIHKARPKMDDVRLEEVISACVAHGIQPRAHLMIGFPWEGPTEIEDTARLALRMRAAGMRELNVFIVKFYEGTPLLKAVAEQSAHTPQRLSQTRYVDDWKDEPDSTIARKLRRFNEVPLVSGHPRYSVGVLRQIVRNLYRVFFTPNLGNTWQAALWHDVFADYG